MKRGGNETLMKERLVGLELYPHRCLNFYPLAPALQDHLQSLVQTGVGLEDIKILTAGLCEKEGRCPYLTSFGE